MKLFGREWTKRELLSRVGNIAQIGGVKRLTYSEGKAAGVEIIEVRTGAGLTFHISPTLGFDITFAEYNGVPLTWQSPNGIVNPFFYQPNGTEWLKTASGGMLMTCGLLQVGSPCEDNEEQLGLHGEIHHTPAKNVSATAYWDEDDYIISASGVVEETSIFGSFLQLRREIKCYLGENRIMINDVVENIGFEEAPHMILYHFNLGFPFITSDTKLDFPSQKVVARNEHVAIENYDKWNIPQKDYEERVYYHENLKVDENDQAKVTMENPVFLSDKRNLALEISWNTRNLPNLIQWKMLQEGIYVLGVEPSNCHVEGRSVEREKGTLSYLAPGEEKHYYLVVNLNTN
ncbi:aldose 1-epimerase family protein [Pontibacillus marinus]|uniref:DUF4432 domain-containing protein n=1 Tax=Pontibacillus marinus BH030004 = DSM 16465 TaxID=1385511 RepID=A0A0A5HLS4_9BACI|nr:aldose 1-epimerase family protein [Pontibacillus marinus]KGX84557.1 hypothetical protein N783_16600 [Pontibacillus marinus BH030004 = DSM 16465]